MTAQTRLAQPGSADLPAGVRPPRFALFAEMLLVGAVVSVLSLGIVTVLPALAAGVGHLHRHAALRSDRFGQLLADFRGGFRGVWAYALALPPVLALLAFNILTVSTAVVPGLVVRWVSMALMAAIAVVILRAAARRAGEPIAWRDAIRLGRSDAFADLGGSALLLAAVALCVVVVWMLPILVLVAPGMLTLAVVAVALRRGDQD